MAYKLGSTGSNTSPGTFKKSDKNNFNSQKPLNIGRAVKTDIHSIPGGSSTPKPISMSLLGGPSVPRTSNEATAIVNIEANKRSGRNKTNTKGKNIGNYSGGRV